MHVASYDVRKASPVTALFLSPRLCVCVFFFNGRVRLNVTVCTDACEYASMYPDCGPPTVPQPPPAACPLFWHSCRQVAAMIIHCLRHTTCFSNMGVQEKVLHGDLCIFCNSAILNCFSGQDVHCIFCHSAIKMHLRPALQHN